MHRIAILIVIATSLFVDAADPKKDKPKEDSEQLQGKWVVESAEIAGKALKVKIVGDMWTFEKDKWTINHISGNTDSGTFQLDPTKKTKQIDMTGKDGDKPGKGIYELNGDTLKICIDESPEEERPTKFGTDPARKKLFVIVLKRAKN